MGCDIHAVFQTKKDGKWEFIQDKYERNRHYQLFAVLAGVRNGYGFAGITTGDAVVPISEPRGFPDDWECEDEVKMPGWEFCSPWQQEYAAKNPAAYPNGPVIWLGDHSYSWLTADEMLAWLENAPEVTQRGVLSRAEYAVWDKKSHPESYCGDVMGPNIVISTDSPVLPNEATHVRVTWKSPLTDELKYFFDEVRRLKEEHGEVRMVFGFDS